MNEREFESIIGKPKSTKSDKPLIGALIGQKKDTSAIALLNLLLGWTVVGWIVALIWANKSQAGNQS